MVVEMTLTHLTTKMNTTFKIGLRKHNQIVPIMQISKNNYYNKE
jgi:hypothetical protein